MSPEPSAAFPAATVVLLRPAPNGADTETFLLRRARGAAFLANADVFPGGRVDAEDADPSWAARCSGADALTGRLAARLSRDDALRHGVAAVREVFEETGVLLGVPRRAFAANTLSHARAQLLAGTESFLAWCAEGDVTLHLARLLPWAHWITPESEPRRFDTWFFVCRLQSGEECSLVEGEAVAGRWMPLRDALAQQDADTVALAPPTLRTVEELAAIGTLDAIEAASAQRLLHPILPRLSLDGRSATIVLPGDPDYPVADHVAIQGPTRFVLKGKRWVPQDDQPEGRDFSPGRSDQD